MAHLLAHEPAFRAFGSALADEDFAEEGVEGFLDAVARLPTGVLLPAEAGEEPFEHGEHAAVWCRLVGGGAEEVRVLDPVAGEFCCGLVCEDEGWRGDVTEVAFDRCYGLCRRSESGLLPFRFALGIGYNAHCEELS